MNADVEFKIVGATEFIDFMIVKYNLPLGEETAMLEDLEEYIDKVSSL